MVAKKAKKNHYCPFIRKLFSQQLLLKCSKKKLFSFAPFNTLQLFISNKPLYGMCKVQLNLTVTISETPSKLLTMGICCVMVRGI